MTVYQYLRSRRLYCSRQQQIATALQYHNNRKSGREGKEEEMNAECETMRWIRSLSMYKALNDHVGCVNSIEFNEEGTLLLTGSDDLCFCIYQTMDDWRLQARIRTCHAANLFSCVFVPYHDDQVVSCGLDGKVSLTDVQRASSTRSSLAMMAGDLSAGTDHQYSTVLFRTEAIASRIVFSGISPWVPFISHGDGYITSFDIRCPEQSLRRLVVAPHVEACNVICTNPHNANVFAVGTNTDFVYLFDARYARERSSGIISQDSSAASINMTGGSAFLTLGNSSLMSAQGKRRSDGIGGLNFSSDGQSLVASYKSEDVYVFDTQNALSSGCRLAISDPSEPLACFQNHDFLGQPIEVETLQYKGRKNGQTMFKEAVFFHDDQFIATGGDCGHLFLWDRCSKKLVHRIQADNDIVNGVLSHPNLPVLIACGIDSSSKVFQFSGDLNATAKSDLSSFNRPRIPTGWIHSGYEAHDPQHPNLPLPSESNNIEPEEIEEDDDDDDDATAMFMNYIKSQANMEKLMILVQANKQHSPPYPLSMLRKLEADLGTVSKGLRHLTTNPMGDSSDEEESDSDDEDDHSWTTASSDSDVSLLPESDEQEENAQAVQELEEHERGKLKKRRASSRGLVHEEGEEETEDQEEIFARIEADATQEKDAEEEDEEMETAFGHREIQIPLSRAAAMFADNPSSSDDEEQSEESDVVGISSLQRQLMSAQRLNTWDRILGQLKYFVNALNDVMSSLAKSGRVFENWWDSNPADEVSATITTANIKKGNSNRNKGGVRLSKTKTNKAEKDNGAETSNKAIEEAKTLCRICTSVLSSGMEEINFNEEDQKKRNGLFLSLYRCVLLHTVALQIQEGRPNVQVVLQLCGEIQSLARLCPTPRPGEEIQDFVYVMALRCAATSHGLKMKTAIAHITSSPSFLQRCTNELIDFLSSLPTEIMKRAEEILVEAHQESEEKTTASKNATKRKRKGSKTPSNDEKNKKPPCSKKKTSASQKKEEVDSGSENNEEQCSSDEFDMLTQDVAHLIALLQ